MCSSDQQEAECILAIDAEASTWLSNFFTPKPLVLARKPGKLLEK